MTAVLFFWSAPEATGAAGRPQLTQGRPMLLRTMPTILDAVAVAFEVPRDDLVGRVRTQQVAEARHAAVWIARKTTRLSYSQIGRKLGGRDHTTTLASHGRAVALHAADREFRASAEQALALVEEVFNAW
ncbi:MAG: helix-turn-helix domain-containing protein [Sphingomonadaceae bacterium]